MGYFAYDYIKYVEPSLKLKENLFKNNNEDDESFKDVDLMLFDKVIVFDNLKQKIFLIVNIKSDNIEKEYELGIAQLMELKKHNN